MSIALVSSTQTLQVEQTPIVRGSPSDSKATGNSQSTRNTAKVVANAEKAIANRVTTTNDNGTVTVSTTYTDGTTSTVTNANPPRPPSSANPLAANTAQLATLLKAQQQSNQG